MASSNQQLLMRELRHTAYYQRLSTLSAQEIARFLHTEVLPDLAAQVATASATGSSSLIGLRKLRKTITNIVKDGFKHGLDDTAKLATQLAKNETTKQKKYLSEAVPFKWQPKVPSLLSLRPKNFEVQGDYLPEWFDNLSTKVANNAYRAMRTGYAEGESVDQITKRLSRVVDQAHNETRTLVRTTLNSVSSKAREDTYAANADVIKGVQIVATLDAVTSDICQKYDGQVFPPGEGPRPPFHFNCRTTTVPILKSWDELNIAGLKEPSAGQRESMDGLVPASLTYNDWKKEDIRFFNSPEPATSLASFNKQYVVLDAQTDDAAYVDSILEENSETVELKDVDRPTMAICVPRDAVIVHNGYVEIKRDYEVPPNHIVGPVSTTEEAYEAYLKNHGLKPEIEPTVLIEPKELGDTIGRQGFMTQPGYTENKAQYGCARSGKWYPEDSDYAKLTPDTYEELLKRSNADKANYVSFALNNGSASDSETQLRTLIDDPNNKLEKAHRFYAAVDSTKNLEQQLTEGNATIGQSLQCQYSGVRAVNDLKEGQTLFRIDVPAGSTVLSTKVSGRTKAVLLPHTQYSVSENIKAEIDGKKVRLVTLSLTDDGSKFAQQALADSKALSTGSDVRIVAPPLKMPAAEKPENIKTVKAKLVSKQSLTSDGLATPSQFNIDPEKDWYAKRFEPYRQKLRVVFDDALRADTGSERGIIAEKIMAQRKKDIDKARGSGTVKAASPKVHAQEPQGIFDPKPHPVAPKEMVNNLKESTRAFQDTLNKIAATDTIKEWNSSLPDASVKTIPWSSSSYAPHQHSVHIAPRSSEGMKTSTFHEYGHALIHEGDYLFKTADGERVSVSSAVKKCVEWRKERAIAYCSSAEPVSTSQGYKAMRGGFINPYTGRVYEGSMANSATEVFSQGLETFAHHDTLGSLLHKDFGHFALIHGLLTGEL